MSYTVAYYTEVRWDSAGKGRNNADKAGEKKTSLTENKKFLLNGSGSVDWDLCFSGLQTACVRLQELTWALLKWGGPIRQVRNCVSMGVFNHDMSLFKAAEDLFSWSEAGVSPAWAFVVFTFGWLSDYDCRGTGFKTSCRQPLQKAVHIATKPTAVSIVLLIQ